MANAEAIRSWARFRSAHLHDYNAPACRFWIAVVLCGAAALAWSLAGLAALPAQAAGFVAAGLAIVAVAAAFPIPIPRSKLSLTAGDLVIFLLLALHGAPAATLAAATEAAIASARTSKRVSSRLFSPAAAATAMAMASALFEAAEQALSRTGMPPAAAHLAALAAASLVYFSSSTFALVQVVFLKRGLQLDIKQWLANTSWVGPLCLGSALIAGLLSLNARQFGQSAAAVGIGVIGLSLAMLREHFRQQIAEHEAQEARVAVAQQRFHAAFTHASIGMAIVDSSGAVVQANEALCSLLGYDEQALHGRAFRGLLHAGDASLLDRHVSNVSASAEDSFSIELRCLGAQQRETWVSLHCARFEHADAPGGEAAGGLIFQLHDITSRRRAEGELHHIAYHDRLTDLANRACFQERLKVAVEQSRSDRRRGFAVMYLDLDRFKIVNDSLGHPAGDELLKEVARRLSLCVRPNDLVARLGGDEFALLLEGNPHHDEVVALGQRLLAELERSAQINGTEIRPQASIGITFSDLGYREPDEVLRDADLAMYKAKADGKGRLTLFDASLHDHLGHKLQLEADLRRAIGDGQLTLAFQPLYELELEPFRLSGFEALARWVHPVRGAISPSVFIALAEETGCIEALTRWAIEEAVRQLAAWRHECPHSGDLVMHVNVSSKDLIRADLVPHVRGVLQAHGVPAQLLTLEITESMLMEQREKALHALCELSELGVKLSIDDFGTGYSSLAYLTTLPFDCLKIDRSFVIGMHKSPQNVEIVRTVLSLGRTLNKQVIAEGIETAEQLSRLRQLGAPIGQGYLLSRPLPAHQAGQLLREPTPASV